MKKITKITAGMLAAAMAFGLTACGNSGTSSSTVAAASESTSTESVSTGDSADKKKIGMLALSLSFDFQIQMNNGIKRAAEENGYEYSVYDYGGDAENMLSGLETLQASNVGALYAIFSAPESASEFMKSNPDIGVLTQGVVVDGAQARTKNDYTTLAEQFVESLNAYVTENNITDGDIAALWLETCENEDSEYFAAKEEIKSVINDWCEGKNFTITNEFYPKDDEEASNMTAQIMNSNPDTRFFFCFNNGYAIAAANEISSAAPDTSEYFVFSSEGDEESFRLIQSGTSPYRACAYMDIEASGYEVGKQLINWVENGKMEDVIATKELVTSANVGDYLK